MPKTFYKIEPDLSDDNSCAYYLHELLTEYRQCVDEGLDIEPYADLFAAASALPDDFAKARIADTLFDIVINTPRKSGYPYNEPSEYAGIKGLAEGADKARQIPGRDVLRGKVLGAWIGRAAGCLLGKVVEGIRTDELLPLLKHSGNYPMHRYILSTDPSVEMYDNFRFDLHGRCFADTVDGMPPDDDTNYTVLYQKLIDRFGRDFKSGDVLQFWLDSQPRSAYFTAEFVAYTNYSNGYSPQDTALYKNPYREWIGAQIRGDYFGYINPGDPCAAAEMAYRDASISHIKNGIYGEMFVSAMIATAAATSDIPQIIKTGLSQIPRTSRLYEAVTSVMEGYRSGASQADCFKRIHTLFDENTSHGWCHVISNAMIVTAALLYGNSNFGKSVCSAVEAGFDTDCNGATVGSVLGMALGAEAIDEAWKKPLNNTIHTTISGADNVNITDLADKTMEHIFRR